MGHHLTMYPLQNAPTQNTVYASNFAPKNTFKGFGANSETHGSSHTHVCKQKPTCHSLLMICDNQLIDQ